MRRGKSLTKGVALAAGLMFLLDRLRRLLARSAAHPDVPHPEVAGDTSLAPA